MNAVKKTERVTESDQRDALRVIECATVLACLPGLMSPAARDLVTVRLRELSANHPNHPCAHEVFATIIMHLESYS